MAEKLNSEDLWKAALGELEITFSKPNFKTWFRDTFISSYADGTVVVGVPNNFTREWLEKKYHTQIATTLRRFDPQIRQIRYAIIAAATDTAALPARSPILPPRPATAKAALSGLIAPHNNFESFVVGKTSQLAYASSQAVAQSPGQLYNPLFIYGGVGLGKTHLLHAIANAMWGQNQKRKIVYTSCEAFMNEFVSAIQSGKMEGFKRAYRQIDALLVDDIQFIANKEGTQEEFFHTFNSLHQTNRQIVIAADRPPNAIPGLEERLASRFGWGMVCDIQPPDAETREAILRKKSAQKQIDAPDDVISHIAALVRSNIRELEGALTRVVGFAQLNHLPLTKETVSNALAGMFEMAHENVTVDKVLGAVSEYFHVPPSDLVSARRTKELVYPRQIAMYQKRHELRLSFPQIGRELGGKDHTTVMHGCTKIEKDMARNPVLKNDLEQIKNQFLVPGR